MDNTNNSGDSSELRPTAEVYSHADCGVCNGDDKACARQARLEATWGVASDRVIEQIDRAADKIEDAYSRIKQVIKPDGAHVDDSGRLKLRSAGGQHLAPKPPSRIHESLEKLQPRNVLAASLIASTALTPIAPMARAEAQPVPAVAPDFDTDQLAPYDFSPEVVISPRLVQLAGAESENRAIENEAIILPAAPERAHPAVIQVELDSEIEQPLTRTLFPGQTIKDFANRIAGDSPRTERVEMIEQIAAMSGVDLKAGEDRQLKVGYELKLPIDISDLDPKRDLYTVKKGDTSAQLYAELGFKAEGYSFEQFLEMQAIVDRDSIRSGWQMLRPSAVEQMSLTAESEPAAPPVPTAPVSPAEEQVPVPARKPATVSPEQSPKSPLLIEGPPDDDQLAFITRRLQAELPEIGQIEIEDDQISLDNGRYMNRQEAISALNLLVAAAQDYENPLHDLPVPPIEQLPTPEADGLRTRQEAILDDLVSGDTNLAYLQSDLLQRLAVQPDGQVDAEKMKDIANHFVRFIAERNDWVVSDEQAATLAGLMLRGAMPLDMTAASHAQLEAASTADRLNHSALTIDLYQSSLRGYLDEQIELVKLAERQLELLRSNMRDLSEEEIVAIAQNVVSTKRSGQPANDYSYEVFRAKLGEQTNESTVLKLLGRQLYAARNSDDLLELLPSVETRLGQTVDDWLSAEGPKSLSGLLDTIDSQLDGQIAAITERGVQLQEMELDLEDLHPELANLSGEQIYELAKTILSAEENKQRVGDDWLYLIELKAPAGETLDQTLLKLMAGIYRVQGADLLLAGSGKEQTAAAEAVEQFTAGDDRNVKAFLDGQYDSLEQRLAAAEGEAMKVVDTVKGVLPELSLADDKLSALPVRRLLGQTNQELVGELSEAYEYQTGRQLTPEQTALIDVGLIRLEMPDRADRLDGFSQRLLEYYNQQAANFYLEGVNDPAIQTLALLLEKGQHVIDYGDTEMSIFSEEFLAKVRAYNTIPSSLFPGTQWLIKGYAGQDLRPFFERLGLDADAILASPYNDQLKVSDGRITADMNGAIWFSAELWDDQSAPDFEEAVDWVYGEIPGLKYTVKEGQTYSEIAQMFRVKNKPPHWEELVEWNRGRIPSDPTKLRTGTEIVIPENWVVHIDLDYPEPPPRAPESGESANSSWDIFAETGVEIKEDLKADAPSGESGRLESDQLAELGSAWQGESLHPDAAGAFLMLNEAFEAEFGHAMELTDAYRSYDEQVSVKEYWSDQGRPEMAATPGKSNHGWGLAIDIGDQQPGDGKSLTFSQAEYDWLMANAGRFGWVNPDWAHDGQGAEEAWHWEYIGKPEVSSEAANSYPVLERYEPGSEAFVQLFTAAADAAGVPREWATSQGLVELVAHESGGWVGIPNYTYGDRKKDREQWDDIHDELKQGEITAESSATGLGQLLSKNAANYYPSGVNGIGNPFEEAVGMLNYIKTRYGDPATAWGNHSANPDRWEGVEKIYDSNGY